MLKLPQRQKAKGGALNAGAHRQKTQREKRPRHHIASCGSHRGRTFLHPLLSKLCLFNIFLIFKNSYYFPFHGFVGIGIPPTSLSLLPLLPQTPFSPYYYQEIWNTSQICMSCLLRGHADLLWIIPSLVNMRQMSASTFTFLTGKARFFSKTKILSLILFKFSRNICTIYTPVSISLVPGSSSFPGNLAFPNATRKFCSRGQHCSW